MIIRCNICDTELDPPYSIDGEPQYRDGLCDRCRREEEEREEEENG